MRSTSSKVLWVIVVANVLTALIAIVTNVATGVLPDAWQPYLWIAWPVLAALVLSGIPLVIYLRRTDAGHPAVTDDRAEFSRKAMLAQVRTMWVNGVLTQSLYQQTLVELGLEERPGFLRRPWDMMLETADQRPRPVEPGTRLVDVVERYRGLLMLGAPGAGKTTMLLTLLEDLLDVATHDKTAPIPVVFPLASWSSDSKPLEEWFVEELCGPLYGLSPELARSWIANDRVLPLLDGLDEVVLDKRLACAQAIEAFHRTHRLLPLVVASRIADYNALGFASRWAPRCSSSR